MGTNYGMNLAQAPSNDPYGMEPFADIKIGGGGAVTRSNSQLARAIPGSYKSGLG